MAASLCCRGSSKDTRGTAYVVYEDIYDAKTAVDHLSGFNVANRYLIVLYYNTSKQNKKVSPQWKVCFHVPKLQGGKDAKP
jgi:pre-mRNA branch site protein p14